MYFKRNIRIYSFDWMYHAIDNNSNRLYAHSQVNERYLKVRHPNRMLNMRCEESKNNKSYKAYDKTLRMPIFRALFPWWRREKALNWNKNIITIGKMKGDREMDVKDKHEQKMANGKWVCVYKTADPNNNIWLEENLS